ncbi:MAG: DUF3369 domain-containing protein [Spirochaetaceae bacterium]|nr:DUF3369 domain-containing protein [Spirochaetaceae bacterium]
MEWLKDEKSVEKDLSQEEPWIVLIIDDDDQIHEVTKLALSSFTFEDKPLKFFSVFSAQEARDFLLNSTEHFSVFLLDVVMEEDDAGLKLAKYIREDLKNHYTRIILRTGQPGFAPEYSVIKDYDIDAYKNKTELKRADLESVFYTSLRSYRDISFLQLQRKCIEQVVASITHINSTTDLPDFASALLNQIGHLTGIEEGRLILEPSETFAVSRSEFKTRVLASSGKGHMVERNEIGVIDSEARALIDESLNSHCDVYAHPYFVHYMQTQRNNEIVLALKSRYRLSEADEELLILFSSNVILTYENLILSEEISESQNLIVRLLGGAVESRSLETGSHVRRVGELAALLTSLSGGTLGEIEMMRVSAPLHDVGKISIPDFILNKPEKLNDKEWSIIKTHSLNGFNLLKDTGNIILDKAAIIALDHHERWDGTGYPSGKKGLEISLDGRIVAIADVLDALVSRRCYKSAWSYDQTMIYMKKMKGSQFDPELTDLLLENSKEVYDIYLKYPD